MTKHEHQQPTDPVAASPEPVDDPVREPEILSPYQQFDVLEGHLVQLVQLVTAIADQVGQLLEGQPR